MIGTFLILLCVSFAGFAVEKIGVESDIGGVTVPLVDIEATNDIFDFAGTIEIQTLTELRAVEVVNIGFTETNSEIKTTNYYAGDVDKNLFKGITLKIAVVNIGYIINRTNTDILTNQISNMNTCPTLVYRE